MFYRSRNKMVYSERGHSSTSVVRSEKRAKGSFVENRPANHKIQAKG